MCVWSCNMHDYKVKTETALKAVKLRLDIHVGRVPIAHYLKSSQTCSRLPIVCSGFNILHSKPFLSFLGKLLPLWCSFFLANDRFKFWFKADTQRCQKNDSNCDGIHVVPIRLNLKAQKCQLLVNSVKYHNIKRRSSTRFDICSCDKWQKNEKLRK